MCVCVCSFPLLIITINNPTISTLSPFIDGPEATGLDATRIRALASLAYKTMKSSTLETLAKQR